MISSKVVQQNGDGRFTPVGYYRLGASAPRRRTRGYTARRRRSVYLATMGDTGAIGGPVNVVPSVQGAVRVRSSIEGRADVVAGVGGRTRVRE